ncbi:hypothetical protein BCR37DRAFT_380402 [Protomyces lactucae-debilis]|uniref:ferroxidase n=1 Tax=Protomyces lactucae-debilis TaxID=2754530 RepID=A0A1Y2FC72_PROLT|nr:uncharacterized protein BCR37DRAFT_380402 [Protomyces lactucae-debilis]ORY81501.1 hypothetical protein BCR37DRAFT_380402 [Protomyces lactucae-debilis]
MSLVKRPFSILLRRSYRQPRLASHPRQSTLCAYTNLLNAQPRLFSTTTFSRYDHAPSTLTDRRYFQLADTTLSHLLTELEREADANDLLEDVEYADGVMNVTVATAGTYVINRQPPSKQVWLSSPLSGPKRFDYVEGVGWVYKDGTALKALLVEEWTQAGLKIDLEGLGLHEHA